MKFAVIGGDLRQAKLAELLAKDGNSVSVYALDKIRFEGDIFQASSFEEAAANAECVVFPLPVTSKPGIISTPLSSRNHFMGPALKVLSPEQIVLAGRIDENTYAQGEKENIRFIDYFKREELTVCNAAITAEGAVQIIMEETPITICGAKCLVIGFGRIGKILANRLRSLGGDVTVSARKFSDFEWIRAYGYKPAETEKIKDILEEFDVIVNTVPTRILGEEELKCVKDGGLCLDLASKPGGIDFAAAARIGKKAMWALSLPGEVAPVTSGEIIKKTIYNILHELEEEKCQN